MKIQALSVSALLLAAGCSTSAGDYDGKFGASYSANNKAQIIDPAPAQGAPAGDGTAADLAILRYKTDQVKKGETGSFTPEGRTSESSN